MVVVLGVGSVDTTTTIPPPPPTSWSSAPRPMGVDRSKFPPTPSRFFFRGPVLRQVDFLIEASGEVVVRW